ncbi:hypothetical protein AALP_AA7G027500 [Arabis alpina]|uniref:Zinc knuckle CX2CX4HX4C domain-containing protein n=1 Tax=Arabis alpina TaxID=50452 RepID=A0A087GFK0_ARAAL|nr:hypothetical protein AALP_AA7G027500 [Arabis alpina]
MDAGSLCVLDLHYEKLHKYCSRCLRLTHEAQSCPDRPQELQHKRDTRREPSRRRETDLGRERQRTNRTDRDKPTVPPRLPREKTVRTPEAGELSSRPKPVRRDLTAELESSRALEAELPTGNSSTKEWVRRTFTKAETTVVTRKRTRRDPDVTLARASDGRLDTFIPMGIPLAGPSDRCVSDVSSPRIELPEHRFDDVPQKVSRDSSSGGSSYARSGGDSKISETSNRVETEEGTSGGERGSFVDFRNAEPKSPGPGLGHGDFYLPLEDNSPEVQRGSSQRKKSSTPSKKKTVQSRPKKTSMVKLNLDVVDSDEEFEAPKTAPPTVREGLRPEKAPITHGRVRVGDGDGSSSSPFDFAFDFRGGGEHISQVPLACLQFVRCVRGGPDFISPPAVDPSSSDPDTRFAMSAISENGELIASRDDLSSKVDALTSALAEAEEAKKDVESRIEGEVAELRNSSKDAVARAVEEAKKKAKDKLRRSIEIMEERSKAQTEADRLASLASQVVGAIRRMDIAAKDGVAVDAAKKEKLEARLASYTAEADSIVLPSLPTDSSDDEETEPKKGVALDISSSDSSDEEGEKSETGG